MERRHQIRIPLSTEVAIQHGGGDVRHETANVSEGGMFVPMAEPLAVGTEVRFQLRLPGDRRISGEARVVWRQIDGAGARPRGNGLEFGTIADDGRALLVAAIREHLEKQPMIRAGA